MPMTSSASIRSKSILTIGAILTGTGPNGTTNPDIDIRSEGVTSLPGVRYLGRPGVTFFGSQESERFVVEQQTASRKVLPRCTSDDVPGISRTVGA